MELQFLLGEKLNSKYLFEKKKIEWYCFVSLSIAAIILFGFNLGQLPLRDWDEGIVAQVAVSVWKSPHELDSWLYPQIQEQPYFNKPPLIHWLIALTYLGFGVSEWSSRLVPAILSAISVPLLYLIGREIFPQRSMAVFSALVYLTFLPIVRHGRLAMLDGAAISFFLLLIWCLLRAYKSPRSSLGSGLALAAICLTKGIMMGILLGGIAVIFLFWDNRKIFKSKFFWTGIIIGLIPVIVWYGCQYYKYGEQFININFIQQTFSRIWQPVDNQLGDPWYYLLEIFKYAWPWLIFSPGGIKLALENKNETRAKLIIVWIGIYLLAVSLMSTKLPWYVLPIYPALALLIGSRFDRIWHDSKKIKYPIYWSGMLSLLTILIWGAGTYLSFGWFNQPREPDLKILFTAVGLTMTIAAILTIIESRYFILVLTVGLYVSLLLFFNSNNWIWELAETYPVKPVAEIVASETPPGQIIYTSYPYYRPSLNFYSDRQVIPVEIRELKSNWQQNEKPYFLIETKIIKNLNLEDVKVLNSAIGWEIITKKEAKLQ